jgi:hypothetical protein
MSEGWLAAWRALADKELAGAPLASLTPSRDDGLVIDPIATSDTTRGEGMPAPAAPRSWVVVTDRASDAALASEVGGLWWRSADAAPSGLHVVVCERPPMRAGVSFDDSMTILLAGVHEHGASAITQVAIGVGQLLVAAERGRPLRIAVAVGTELFVEIAKLRALRRLAGRALAATGVSQPIWIAARSDDRSLARLDVPTNAIRATIACAAAMIGGADVIAVSPMDLSTRGARLARNTAAILERESHLLAVDDAARGAFAIEALTDRIARDAWERAREMARQNDAAAWIQRDAAARRASVASGERVLVGVNKFQIAEQTCVDPGPDDPRDAAPIESTRSTR